MLPVKIFLLYMNLNSLFLRGGNEYLLCIHTQVINLQFGKFITVVADGIKSIDIYICILNGLEFFSPTQISHIFKQLYHIVSHIDIDR